MPQPAVAVAFGSVAVLTLDTLGAVASKRVGIRYQKLAPLSALVYASVGAAAGAGAHYAVACVSAGTVGFIDATVGWRIAWVLDAARPPVELRGVRRIAVVVTRVTLGAAGFGLTGAALLHLFGAGST